MKETSPSEIEWWQGRLAGVARPTATVTLRAPIRVAASSGAGAFLGIADDRKQYWVKVPGNPQGDGVLVNEVIVGELGLLLGAPVRPRALVRVPAELVREWGEYPVRATAQDLIAHGSLHLDSAVDEDHLRYTKDDDNARRQARLLGLWDLCIGDDEQWLYDISAKRSIWSYDHGFWFASGEGDWDRALLQQMVDLDGSWREEWPRALDREAILEFADRLESVTPGELLRIVGRVPVEWGTDDRDLEAMGWFLYRRRISAATRLRRHANG